MIKKSDIKFIQCASFLFFLIPCFLINFIFFSDFFLVLIDFIFLYFVIKYKKYNYFKNIYCIFFYFFI